MEVNGKIYPMWGQFVQKQKEWIGGILEDLGDDWDRRLGLDPLTTKITGIELRPNGDESAFFEVKGESFDCGFDVQIGGIGAGEEGWITFGAHGGHTWRIKPPEK